MLGQRLRRWPSIDPALARVCRPPDVRDPGKPEIVMVIR